MNNKDFVKMRKISKFRAWLIRKLGGIPACKPINPLIVERKIHTETFTATISFTPEQEDCYSQTSEEELEQRVKKLFLDNLEKQISDYITFDFDRDEFGNLNCRGSITLTKPTEY